jgi:hypothetical protein
VQSLPRQPWCSRRQPKTVNKRRCNADAKSKGLTGADRKAFMKTCLSADSGGDGKTLNSQQQKMKDCNADAKAKKLAGDERKKFMSDCLKGSASGR